MGPTRRAVSSLACAAVLCACASTPKQAVQLSVTVGRDVEAVHAAHVALVKRYFDRMEADVNAFVDGTYRPYMIGETMRKFQLVEKIRDPSKAGGLDALDVMQAYVTSLTKAIEAYREELLQPIRSQRAMVLESLEKAYRQIQDANAIVTGHLASIVAVQDAQDEVLKQAGLAGLREKIVDSTAKASDEIAELTRKGTLARDRTQEIEKAAKDLKNAAQSLGK